MDLINAYSLARLVQTLFNFYSFLLLAYCMISWFPMSSGRLKEDIGAVLEKIVDLKTRLTATEQELASAQAQVQQAQAAPAPAPAPAPMPEPMPVADPFAPLPNFGADDLD